MMVVRVGQGLFESDVLIVHRCFLVLDYTRRLMCFMDLEQRFNLETIPISTILDLCSNDAVEGETGLEHSIRVFFRDT